MLQRTRLVVALSALAFVTAAPPARADVAPEPEISDEYRRLVEEAVRESAAGRWAEARGLFRSAYQIDPNARAMRGIAMTSFELRDYTEAYRALVASLADTRRPLDAEQREHAEALLARSAAFIGRFDTSHLGAGVSFSVDGVQRELEPDGTLILAEGEREVVATFPDGRSAHARWRVRGGDAAPLPIAVPEEPAPSPEPVDEPAPDPEPVASAPAERDADPGGASDAGTERRPLALIGAGAGGAAMVAGAIVLALGRRDIQDVESAADGTPYSAVRAADRRAPKLTGAGAVLMGLGAASAVVGVILWRMGPSDDEEGEGTRANVGISADGRLHAEVTF